MADGRQEALGMAAVQAKGEWWFANHEIHSAAVTGPRPNGKRFIVGFQYDITFKPTGKRIRLDEVGVYTSDDEKSCGKSFSMKWAA